MIESPCDASAPGECKSLQRPALHAGTLTQLDTVFRIQELQRESSSYVVDVSYHSLLQDNLKGSHFSSHPFDLFHLQQWSNKLDLHTIRLHTQQPGRIDSHIAAPQLGLDSTESIPLHTREYSDVDLRNHPPVLVDTDQVHEAAKESTSYGEPQILRILLAALQSHPEVAQDVSRIH